jgi:glycosyl transferase family 25
MLNKFNDLNKLLLCIICVILAITALLYVKDNFKDAFTNSSELWIYKIDAIVYINIYSRKDRNQNILDVLEKLHVPKEKIHRIDATYIPGNGHKGCAKSHMDAIKLGIDNKWNNMLILEDDIKASVDSEVFNNKFNDLINKLNNSNVKWDVLMLASTDPEKLDTNYDPQIKKIKKAYGSMAYIVNKHYMQTMYDIFEKSYNIQKMDEVDFTFNTALDKVWLPYQKNDGWYALKDDLFTHLYEIPSTIKDTETSSSANKIPKKIHQVWIGSDPESLPMHKKLYMTSFKKIMPSYEYKLWTDEDITNENFPITIKYLEKISQLNSQSKYACMCDLMRLEIIYKHGGFYFDTNIELLKPIDNLLNYKFVVCNESELNPKEYTFMSNGFFGAIPKSKYISRILNDVELSKLVINENSKIVSVSGPMFFCKTLNSDELTSNNNIKVLHHHAIYPVIYYEKLKDKSILSYEENSKFQVVNDSSNIPDYDIYITTFKDVKYKIQFPTKGYNNSYAIDHFMFGCSWC